MVAAFSFSQLVASAFRRKIRVASARSPRCGFRLQAEDNNIPNARQINAFPVAMKKSSVPLGEKSSMSVLAIAMTTATPIHAGAMP